VLIGGKAAPGYVKAKQIIELVCRVSHKINSDSDIGDLLKVVFLPNYCVSAAQIIIPGAELSQHISTAGTEASGTSNMKFAMNGCLIIGTMDGANVEIAEEVGTENMFIFGLDIKGVSDARERLKNGFKDYVGTRLQRVLSVIRNGFFGGNFNELIDNLYNCGDSYLVCHDFYSYIAA
jgi:starch phosphorylase